MPTDSSENRPGPPTIPRYDWAILSGEYPPQPGGVSDYSRLVAGRLATAGDGVQVWAPPADAPTPADEGVAAHRLPDHFGFRSLARLTHEFARLPPDARVLVQYVPHAFGWKAMNLPFCLWLWTQRRREVVLMFHEVATPWAARGEPWRLNFLSFVTRLMAALAGCAARRVFLSVPGWEPVLRPLVGGDKPMEWMPVPSNIPGNSDPARVAALRREHLVGNDDGYLIGHFGTFGGHIAEGLRQVVPELLDEEARATVLLVGRGGEAFAAELLRRHPRLASRLRAVGQAAADTVAEHLSACDLLIQPYGDGVSSRRGSAMAGLACARPILTTRGILTESLWEASGAVCLVDSFGSMAKKAVELLADPPARARLCAAAQQLYAARFHLDRTVTLLRSTHLRPADMVSAP